MTRNGMYVRVLLVVMVLAILVAFLGRNSQSVPRDSWLPSSFNPVGAGHLAFYETLQDLRWPVERWREPLSRLESEGNGNALIITRSALSWKVPFTDQEAELLDAWVGKGNTLFLLGPMAKWEDTRLILEQMGFVVPEDKTLAPLFSTWRPHDQAQLEIAPVPGESGKLVLPADPALPAKSPVGTRTLWSASGLPYIMDVPHGRGHVVCIASAQILDNHYLTRGDNFAILLRLLAPMGEVPHHLFFEESHHGYTAGYALARLIGHPGVRFALLLSLLGLATFLGSSFVRFGPIVPLRRGTERSALEFVDSVADLYRRNDLRNETIRFLYEDTHRQVLERLHLPANAPHELIASRLKQARPDLPGWKKLAHRFESQDYVAGLPPTGWLRVARELIQIRSSLV